MGYRGKFNDTEGMLLSNIFKILCKMIVLPLEFSHIVIDPGQIQASIIKDPCVSVKRILWSPDGSLFGKIEHTGPKQFAIANDLSCYV